MVEIISEGWMFTDCSRCKLSRQCQEFYNFKEDKFTLCKQCTAYFDTVTGYYSSNINEFVFRFMKDQEIFTGETHHV